MIAVFWNWFQNGDKVVTNENREPQNRRTENRRTGCLWANR
jgi:hypothetical protein